MSLVRKKMRRVNRLLNYKFFSLLGNFLGISCFGVKLEKNLNVQGRQSVPKSGRSERGGARNFGVYQTIAPKNLLFKDHFCPEQGLSAMNFQGGAEKW